MNLSKAKAGALAMSVLDLIHSTAAGIDEIAPEDWDAAMALLSEVAGRMPPKERAAIYDITDGLKSLRGPYVEPVVELGSRWTARHARGRKDAIVFTVRGVSAAGVYVSSPESRSPGHLTSYDEFQKLYEPAPREVSQTLDAIGAAQ